MGFNKQTFFKETDIIRASEIGQYHYCSIAWYLQKCGYKPKSPKLYLGKKKHFELGRIMDHTQYITKKSRVVSFIGYLMLILGILIILLEVLL